MSKQPRRRKTIVFQGEPGANSHIACQEAYPDLSSRFLPDLRGRLQCARLRARPISA